MIKKRISELRAWNLGESLARAQRRFAKARDAAAVRKMLPPVAEVARTTSTPQIRTRAPIRTR